MIRCGRIPFATVFLALAVCVIPVGSTVSADSPALPDLTDIKASTRELETGLVRIRDFLAQSASSSDALLLQNVTIRVASDLIQSHSAASKFTRSNGREVIVALSLAYELNLASATQFVEHAFGVPDLMVRYSRHFHESYLYSGRKLLSIEDFAFLDQASRDKLSSDEVQKAIGAWTECGMAFVLAHELGHHAQNALYLPTDSEAEKRRKETLADEWAAQAMLAAGYSPIHGVMLVAYLLDAEERFLPGNYEGDHPFMVDRALHLLDKFRAKQDDLFKTARYSHVPMSAYITMEDEWKKELEAMRQRRLERTLAKMEQDSANGDIDASEALALNYMYGVGVPKDAIKAAQYLERAATAGDFWAQSTLGVMYSNGTLGSPDLARARLWLGLADAVGEKAATMGIGIIERTASPVPWCQGKCVLDAVRADLAPCEAHMQARCVDSCVNQYGHNKTECETRFCNDMSDERRYFARCFSAPSAARWQACRATCDPTAPHVVTPAIAPAGAVQVPNNDPPSPSDDFGAAIQQLVDAAPKRFAPIRGAADPRDAENIFTTYHVSLSIPGMKDCDVTVYDDTTISPRYTCEQYRGSDRDEGARAYKLVVGQLNSALARMQGAESPCTESTRQTEGRVKRDITECRSKLSNGTVIRVRRAYWTYTSSGNKDGSVMFWVDAPER